MARNAEISHHIANAVPDIFAVENRLYERFYAENRAVNAPEKRRENSEPCHNGRELIFGLFREDKPEQRNDNSLTDVAEHNPEHQHIGNRDVRRGVEPAVNRQPVHLRKHLERTRDYVVSELYGNVLRVLFVNGNFHALNVLRALDDSGSELFGVPRGAISRKRKPPA